MRTRRARQLGYLVLAWLLLCGLGGGVPHAQDGDDEEAAAEPTADDAPAADDEAPAPEDAAPAPAGDEAPAPGADAAPAATTDYPEEALALLPRELLDQLPRLATRFLRPEHYVRLEEACPGPAQDAVLQCLAGQEELLGELITQGVLASMVEQMDVDLPTRLTADDYVEISTACETDGNKWAECVLANDVDAPACEQAEEALATCLVRTDLVVDHYLAIVADKKAVFGRELYVEFAGLMAVLPLDAVKALREACPQDDQAAAAACFRSHPAVGEVIGVFYEIAAGVVAEAAQEISAAGNTLDVDAYTEKVFYLFLTLPSRTVVDVVRACEQQHPELTELTEAGQLDAALACIEAEAQTDPIANPAYISKEQLRGWLAAGRAKVIDTLRTKERKAQWAAFQRILIALGVVAALGFVIVLLTPLGLKQRYPDRMPLLWKASAIAAATFAVTVMLLGATLLTMRSVQGVVATDSTSPKMKIADGAFEVLSREDYVEGFSELSKVRLDFIKGPLRGLLEGDPARVEQATAFAAYVALHWAQLLEEPELKQLARNVKTLKAQADSFRSAIGVYRKVDWVIGLLPIILTILAVLLYLLPLRQTLIDIASAPARAAASGARQDVMGTATRTVGAELRSLLPFLGLVLVLLPVIGLFLSIAVPPLVELLLSFSLLTLFYILFADASAAVLYLSLGSAVVLLVAAMAVYIVAMVFYIGTARKIFRSRFHFGHRLAEYRRFWIHGTLALLGVLLYPVVFVLGVDAAVSSWFDPQIEALGAKDMVLIPLTAAVLFVPLMWATRALAALKFIKGYPVQLVRSDAEGALAVAEAAADATGR